MDRGEVCLLVSEAATAAIPPRLAAVVRESHLEAMEAVLALVRRRRHDGIADSPTIAGLLERLRAKAR